MPLQSRMDPFGQLIYTPARGELLGNRGGRIHTDNKELTSRRWVSKRWICCKLQFKNRKRKIWDKSYTELFFLDEVTAFAAGHRPCFECRRKEAELFARLFPVGIGRTKAAVMDQLLHAERLTGRRKRTHVMHFDSLPSGVVVIYNNHPYAIEGARLLRWTDAGYEGRVARPEDGIAEVLTPPSIVAVLRAGFRPQWHRTAFGLHLAA